jgi:hypothetical protein
MAGVLALQVNLAVNAANTALNAFKPTLHNIGGLLAKYTEVLNELSNPSKTEESINILTNEARNHIVEDATEKIKNIQTEEEAERIILETKNKLILLNNQNGGQRYNDQTGGKKILSRTNKSIAQFLNSKVTFQSILKRMTSKYKKGKHGFTRGTKRRLHKR